MANSKFFVLRFKRGLFILYCQSWAKKQNSTIYCLAFPAAACNSYFSFSLYFSLFKSKKERDRERKRAYASLQNSTVVIRLQDLRKEINRGEKNPNTRVYNRAYWIRTLLLVKNGAKQPEDADLRTGGAWYAAGGVGWVYGVQWKLQFYSLSVPPEASFLQQ